MVDRQTWGHYTAAADREGCGAPEERATEVPR